MKAGVLNGYLGMIVSEFAAPPYAPCGLRRNTPDRNSAEKLRLRSEDKAQLS